jgi:formate hydrogenlyase transcriptional activator
VKVPTIYAVMATRDDSAGQPAQALDLQLIIDSTPGLIHTSQPDGFLDFFNATWLRYVGRSLEHLQGWKWTAYIHPDDVEGIVATWRASLASGEPFLYEARVLRADGEYRWMLHHKVALRDDYGEIVKWYGSSIDIEDRRRAEDRIRAQESEIQQVIDFTPQLIAVYGPNHERIYANRIALDYLGIGLDDWQQRSGTTDIHPDESERLRAYAERASVTGSAYELELRMRNRDGGYHWFLARYNPVRDGDGKVVRWYVACTDIEDRKRAEERLQQENAVLREEIDETSMFEEIVGTSAALKAVLSRISKVAPSDSTVLITGETGTGKELVARAIHRRSHRALRSFISVNCAAIPHDLILSELFGHEKGAFTGATARRFGRFELADHGTIFLDEVGELSVDTQVALLRVLQEREFERVGGGQPIPADVRVIAATNRDLEAAVARGAFRQDLFYRLNVFPIEVPPLRKRRDDILMLVEYFVQRYASRAGKQIRSIDTTTLDLLRSYDWPGNIRELQNVIERSVILSSRDVFSVDKLWLTKGTHMPEPSPPPPEDPWDERKTIEAALAESRGRVSGPSGAATKLGIPPSTLESRIKALKIRKGQFKLR